MILLYNPQSSSTRKPCLPLSLLSLSAVLEGEYEHQIVDGNIEHAPLERLDQLIVETKADVLGFTVMPGPQLQEAVPLAKALKQRHPRLPIVWGGYFPSQHWHACLRSGYVDYVVRGHGELVFKSLLQALDHGDEVADIPGLAYLNADGEPQKK